MNKKIHDRIERLRCNLDGRSLSEYFTLGGCLQGLRMVCRGLFGISLEEARNTCKYTSTRSRVGCGWGVGLGLGLGLGWVGLGRLGYSLEQGVSDTGQTLSASGAQVALANRGSRTYVRRHAHV